MMSSTIFDTFTQGLSRQLPTAASIASENRKRGKKQNKKNAGQQKIFSLCKSQILDCEAFAQVSCQGDAACITELTACCDFIGVCNFTGFITCLNDPTQV
jgi:hypothetical protein